RLAIARKGLAVLQQQLAAGQLSDAALTALNLDEDIELLLRRLADDGTLLPPSAVRGTQPRALLVEDNANERQLLATFLRGAGLVLGVKEELDRELCHT